MPLSFQVGIFFLRKLLNLWQQQQQPPDRLKWASLCIALDLEKGIFFVSAQSYETGEKEDNWKLWQLNVEVEEEEIASK